MTYWPWPGSSISGAVCTRSGADFCLHCKGAKDHNRVCDFVFFYFQSDWVPGGITNLQFVPPCCWSNPASTPNWGSKPMQAECYLATCNAQWPKWSLNSMKLALVLTENFSWFMGCWHRCAAGFRRWNRQIAIWPKTRLMTSGTLPCCALSRFSIEAMALAWGLAADICYVQDVFKLLGSEHVQANNMMQLGHGQLDNCFLMIPTTCSKVLEALPHVDSTCPEEIWSALASQAKASCSLAMV